MNWLLLLVVVLGAIITIVAVTLHANGNKKDNSTAGAAASSDQSSSAATNDASGTTASTNSSAGATNTIASDERPSTCPTITPSERTVVFWQSEVDGCEKVPVGVTHIVWGFALVADGVVVPTFQNSDAYIKSCVKSLRRYVPHFYCVPHCLSLVY